MPILVGFMRILSAFCLFLRVGIKSQGSRDNSQGTMVMPGEGLRG